MKKINKIKKEQFYKEKLDTIYHLADRRKLSTDTLKNLVKEANAKDIDSQLLFLKKDDKYIIRRANNAQGVIFFDYQKALDYFNHYNKFNEVLIDSREI